MPLAAEAYREMLLFDETAAYDRVAVVEDSRLSRCGGALCLGRNGPPEAGRRDGRADYFSKRFMMA